MTFPEGTVCSACSKPIDTKGSFDFICFKIPGKDGYRYFHREPCWKDYVKEKES